MSGWLQYVFLSVLLGNPLLAAAVLLVAWWATDRFTLGILPDPYRFMTRWSRLNTLRRMLVQNPHDLQARMELATLLNEGRGAREAWEVLQPCLAGRSVDAHCLYQAGVAAFGSGRFEEGEDLLLRARQVDPRVKPADLELALGRGRLARGRATEARDALEAFCTLRPGSVEGRVLLARAWAREGKAEMARKARAEAWSNYVSAPRFQRRRERAWAWRANPARPALYVGIVGVVLLVLALLPVP